MDIKVGDIVRLNSGGPQMTVASIGTYDGVRKAECVWFDTTTNKEGLFPLESLTKLSEK